MAAGKTIGLFGGTFDPVHNGHLAIARSYLNSGYIDELWVILTPDPPHKSSQKLSAYDLRKEMLEKAFSGMDHVKISDVEKSLPRPSYTIQTVRHLAKQFPAYRFYLCIGEDSLLDFEKWYKWEEILNCCDLLVAVRPDAGASKVSSSIMSHSRFIDHKPVEVSSSELRDNIARGGDVSDLIPPEVYDVIRKQKLYRNP